MLLTYWSQDSHTSSFSSSLGLRRRFFSCWLSEVTKSVFISMSTEVEGKNDLLAHNESRVGQEPETIERNLSESCSRLSKKRKRKVAPRGRHETSASSSESSENDDSESSVDEESDMHRDVIRVTCTRTSR